MSSSPLLLCYDIRDPKRLQKVHREVKKVGMPLQYSVFYIEMNNDEVSRLLKKLTTIIDTSRDDIRVYAISRFDDIAMLGAPFLEDGIQVFSQGRLMFSPST
jgi:CRISPR-associated protein Cas2